MKPKSVYRGEGFTVEPHGLHSVKYSEGERVIIVNGERLNPVSDPLRNGPQYVLYADTLTAWEKPDGHDMLGEDDKAKILARIKEAFDSWSFPYLIEAAS